MVWYGMLGMNLAQCWRRVWWDGTRTIRPPSPPHRSPCICNARLLLITDIRREIKIRNHSALATIYQGFLSELGLQPNVYGCIFNTERVWLTWFARPFLDCSEPGAAERQ